MRPSHALWNSFCKSASFLRKRVLGVLFTIYRQGTGKVLFVWERHSEHFYFYLCACSQWQNIPFQCKTRVSPMTENRFWSSSALKRNILSMWTRTQRNIYRIRASRSDEKCFIGKKGLPTVRCTRLRQMNGSEGYIYDIIFCKMPTMILSPHQKCVCFLLSPSL